MKLNFTYNTRQGPRLNHPSNKKLSLFGFLLAWPRFRFIRALVKLISTRTCAEKICILIIWHLASVLDGRGMHHKAVCIAVDDVSDLFVFIREALLNTHKPCRDPLGLEVFALGTPPHPCFLVMSLCPSKCRESIERGDCFWTCRRGWPECSAVICTGRRDGQPRDGTVKNCYKQTDVGRPLGFTPHGRRSCSCQCRSW